MLILLYLFYYCGFYKFNLIYYRFWPTGKILVLLVRIMVGPKQMFELYLVSCQTWPWNLFISCGICVVLLFKHFKVTMLLLLWGDYESFWIWECDNGIFTVYCSVCVCFYGISFRTQILLFLEPLTVGCWDLIKFNSIFGLILMKLSSCVNIHTHFIFSTNSALTCFSLGQFLNTLVLLYLIHSKDYLTYLVLTVEKNRLEGS